MYIYIYITTPGGPASARYSCSPVHPAGASLLALQRSSWGNPGSFCGRHQNPKCWCGSNIFQTGYRIIYIYIIRSYVSPITRQTQVECRVGICPTYICCFFVSEKIENTQITWCFKYLMFPNDLMAMNNNPLASTRKPAGDDTDKFW